MKLNYKNILNYSRVDVVVETVIDPEVFKKQDSECLKNAGYTNILFFNAVDDKTQKNKFMVKGTYRWDFRVMLETMLKEAVADEVLMGELDIDEILKSRLAASVFGNEVIVSRSFNRDKMLTALGQVKNSSSAVKAAVLREEQIKKAVDSGLDEATIKLIFS